MKKIVLLILVTLLCANVTAKNKVNEKAYKELMSLIEQTMKEGRKPGSPYHFSSEKKTKIKLEDFDSIGDLFFDDPYSFPFILGKRITDGSKKNKIRSFEFVPLSEWDEYRYTLSDISSVPFSELTQTGSGLIVNHRTKNVNDRAYFFIHNTGDNEQKSLNFFDAVDNIKWSGEIVDGKIHGKGVGFYSISVGDYLKSADPDRYWFIENWEYICFSGEYDLGRPAGDVCYKRLSLRKNLDRLNEYHNYTVNIIFNKKNNENIFRFENSDHWFTFDDKGQPTLTEESIKKYKKKKAFDGWKNAHIIYYHKDNERKKFDFTNNFDFNLLISILKNRETYNYNKYAIHVFFCEYLLSNDAPDRKVNNMMNLFGSLSVGVSNDMGTNTNWDVSVVSNDSTSKVVNVKDLYFQTCLECGRINDYFKNFSDCGGLGKDDMKYIERQCIIFNDQAWFWQLHDTYFPNGQFPGKSISTEQWAQLYVDYCNDMLKEWGSSPDGSLKKYRPMLDTDMAKYDDGDAFWGHDYKYLFNKNVNNSEMFNQMKDSPIEKLAKKYRILMNGIGIASQVENWITAGIAISRWGNKNWKFYEAATEQYLKNGEWSYRQTMNDAVNVTNELSKKDKDLIPGCIKAQEFILDKQKQINDALAKRDENISQGIGESPSLLDMLFGSSSPSRSSTTAKIDWDLSKSPSGELECGLSDTYWSYKKSGEIRFKPNPYNVYVIFNAFYIDSKGTKLSHYGITYATKSIADNMGANRHMKFKTINDLYNEVLKAVR